MLQFGLTVLLLAYIPTTVATTCDECKATYTTAKGAASDNPGKCTALATYLTCLETSVKAEAGCPLATADAAAIETDYGTASCSSDTKFTATCICQKEFWKTDQSAGDAAVCSASKVYILCLKGKTDVACDTSSTVVTLATGVETRMTALGTTACLYIRLSFHASPPLTTAPCVATTTIESLKSAAATSITSTTSCTVTTACQCELDAAKADISTDAKKCTAYKTELSCLRTAQSTGCDGTTTKSDIAKTAETARAGLAVTDCQALSATCQCEVDAAKGDASTSAKYCTVLSTLKTCLSAITTTTQKGCNSTTQAALVTDTETKITAAKCGSFADHVTYTMTSLIVPVLVHLFM